LVDDVEEVLIVEVIVGFAVEVGGLTLDVVTDDFEDELELPHVPPTG
jgi:hypothetical protein